MLKNTISIKGVPKFLSQKYVGEPLINPIRSYSDIKIFYPLQLIDSRFQVDHKKRIKNELFDEHTGKFDNARLFIILIRHRETKKVSDGSETAE